MNEPISLLNIVLSWFPMLLLIGVWFFFMMSMRSKSGKSPTVLKEELIELVRQQNHLIEDLVKGQNERIRKLEEK